MKIGYFITLFPYKKSFQDPKFYRAYPIGGAENVAYYLARSMASLGHDVSVFAASCDSKTSEEEMEGVKVYHFGTNLKMGKAFFPLALYTRPSKLDLDIAHLHFSTPPGDLAGLHYANVKNKPFVVTYHGDDQAGFGNFIRRTGLGLYNAFLVDKILSRAQVIISPSEFYVSQSRFLPRFRQKIVSIPNGIDLNEAGPVCSKEECRRKLSLSLQERIILFVGGLIPYKSPNLLIESLPIVLLQVPEARLVLVGDGPMRRELEALAEKLGVSGRVTFAGALVGDSKRFHYGAADVFVLPSTMNTEVFPIVLLEASAAGLPIVVSNLPTFDCIIEDGYNGLKAKLGDINSLAHAIATIVSQPSLGHTLGNNARCRVREYSWDKIGQLTEKAYQMAKEGRTRVTRE
jgi:glycosyltransferase involved in cell wall biosynthesis